MNRTLLLAAAASLSVYSHALAWTEGPQVRVALSAREAGDSIELSGILVNSADVPATGRARLVLPSGLSLEQGSAESAVDLPAKGSWGVSFRARGSVTQRVMAQLVFEPAGRPESYSRGRVFLAPLADALRAMTTAEAIEADAPAPDRPFTAARLPRPLEAPVKTADGSSAVRGKLLWYNHGGDLVPGARATVELIGKDGKSAAAGLTEGDGSFRIDLPASLAGSQLAPRFSLANVRWQVQNDDKAYAWEGPAVTAAAGQETDAGDLVLPKGLPSSEAAWIHGTLVKAWDAFASRGIDVSWWRKVGVNWPASGDYYSWGEVNLTEPYQWDVIGHEFGHAMFFIGTSSQAGGGQHKIDECYTQSLAFSEGFATFFGAVCHLDRADTDAKFQFLVPRRAPIRIENVPEDVCRGEKNEWRVGAALWDLYDTNPDGSDVVSYDFDRIWAWMRAGNRMGSLSNFWSVVQKTLEGADREAARQALQQSGVTLQ